MEVGLAILSSLCVPVTRGWKPGAEACYQGNRRQLHGISCSCRATQRAHISVLYHNEVCGSVGLIVQTRDSVHGTGARANSHAGGAEAPPVPCDGEQHAPVSDSKLDLVWSLSLKYHVSLGRPRLVGAKGRRPALGPGSEAGPDVLVLLSSLPWHSDRGQLQCSLLYACLRGQQMLSLLEASVEPSLSDKAWPVTGRACTRRPVLKPLVHRK